MKAFNYFKSLAMTALILAFGGGLAGCVENDDQQMGDSPVMKLSATTLNFTQEPDEPQSFRVEITGAGSWEVKVADSAYADQVEISPASGNQSADVYVMPTATMTPRQISLTVTLYGDIVGRLVQIEQQTVVINQSADGGAISSEALYFDNFDGKLATQTFGSGTSWPYLDQFTEFANPTGEAAANVTYSGTGISIRANSASNSNYSDVPTASGNNNIFFGANASFVVNGLKLAADQNNLRLQFATEKYSQTLGSVFLTSEFHIWLSKDGENWAEVKNYVFHGGTSEGRWNLAEAFFSLKTVPDTFYIKFTADAASAYRMDDLALYVNLTGTTGQEIDLENIEAGGDQPEQPGGDDSNLTGFESQAAFTVTADDSGNSVYSLGSSTVNGKTATGVKFGTSSKTGTYTTPALGVTGDKYLSFYGFAWKGTTASVHIKINGGGTIDGKTETAVELKGNDGASNNAPFTITATDADYYSMKVTGLTAASTVTLSTTAETGYRVILARVRLTDTDEGPETGSGSGGESGSYIFKKATTVTNGKQYLIVAEGQRAKYITSTYGYLYVDAVKDNNGEIIETSMSNAFTFISTTGGYNIKQSDGKYLYQTGTYNSFNLSDSATSEGVWSVSANNDGTFKILNTSVSKYIQYSSNYTSFGSYSDANGTMPYLYEYAGEAAGDGGNTEPEQPEQPEQPTVKAVSISEFLAAEVSTTQVYELTGTVDNIANTTYGNFDLVDETGKVYVYGLTKEYVASNDKSFGSLGVEKGDKIKIHGYRAVYNNQAQVGSAWLIEIVEKGEEKEPEAPEVAGNKVVFSELGFSNAEDVTAVKLADATLTFDKGTGSNAPKYYNSGTSVRTYANNTITIESAAKSITGIKFVYGATVSAGITPDSGELNDDTWTGKANKVIFTVGATGQQHFQSVELFFEGDNMPEPEQPEQPTPGESKTDVLNQEWTGITGTNYADLAPTKGSASNATYVGQCAGGNGSIQLRSSNNNSGIVTTVSGGKVTKVAVKWVADTADARVLKVYGKNEAYTAATDLYNNATQGTEIASFTKSEGDKEIVIEGEYKYIGFRSSSNALYLDEVQITWE